MVPEGSQGGRPETVVQKDVSGGGPFSFLVQAKRPNLACACILYSSFSISKQDACQRGREEHRKSIKNSNESWAGEKRARYRRKMRNEKKQRGLPKSSISYGLLRFET